MTDAKFCDIHDTEMNVVPKERTWQLVVRQYVPKYKKYMELHLDGCIADIEKKLLVSAKARGLDVEHGWRIQVLIPPNTEMNKNSKWKRAYMSPEEFEEFQKKDNPSLDVEEEEPQAPKARVK